MFGWFKKKTEIEVLSEQYEKLMKESHRLSISDRKASDAKYAQAEAIVKQIEDLKRASQNT